MVASYATPAFGQRPVISALESFFGDEFEAFCGLVNTWQNGDPARYITGVPAANIYIYLPESQQAQNQIHQALEAVADDPMSYFPSPPERYAL